MNRTTRALSALVSTALIASGTAVGLSTPAQATPAAASGSQRADLPILSGTGTVGEPLTVLLGGLATVLPVQWLRDGTAIPGATGGSYVPAAGDIGHTISALVTLPLVGQLTTPGITILGETLDPDDEQAVTPVGDVAVNGSKKIGTVLTAAGPTWDPSDATNSYQWLRDESPIAGATGSTYRLGALDYGRAISVLATGHKEGYTDSTITSNAVEPLIGDQLQFLPAGKPGISGSAKVGGLLTADPGQWTGGGLDGVPPTFAYQWVRDGSEIAGAVAQTYQVRRSEVGRAITVQVTATRPAYKPGRFTTAPLKVAKLEGTLSATLVKKRVKQGQRATMRLALAVAGVAAPTGVVKIVEDKLVVKKAKFAKGKRGEMTLRLGKLKPGVHRLKAVYAGSPTVAGATSKVVKLTVKKPRKR